MSTNDQMPLSNVIPPILKKWARTYSVKILNRVKSRTFNENGDKGKLYRSYDFLGDETRIEACGMMMKVKWGASFRCSSLCCPMQHTDQMTIGKTHSTLLESPLEMSDILYLENLWLQSIAWISSSVGTGLISRKRFHNKKEIPAVRNNPALSAVP